MINHWETQRAKSRVRVTGSIRAIDREGRHVETPALDADDVLVVSGVSAYASMMTQWPIGTTILDLIPLIE